MKKILNYVLSPPPNDKLLVTIKRVGIKTGNLVPELVHIQFPGSVSG